jgi:hypothetical protein
LKEEERYALIERSRFVTQEGAALLLRYLLTQMMDDPESSFWKQYRDALNKLHYEKWLEKRVVK